MPQIKLPPAEGAADPARIYGWTLIGPANHPRDGQPGTVYRTQAGVEILWCGGVSRSLPADWRAHQPPEVA